MEGGGVVGEVAEGLGETVVTGESILIFQFSLKSTESILIFLAESKTHILKYLLYKHVSDDSTYKRLSLLLVKKQVVPSPLACRPATRNAMHHLDRLWRHLRVD